MPSRAWATPACSSFLFNSVGGGGAFGALHEGAAFASLPHIAHRHVFAIPKSYFLFKILLDQEADREADAELGIGVLGAGNGDAEILVERIAIIRDLRRADRMAVSPAFYLLFQHFQQVDRNPAAAVVLLRHGGVGLVQPREVELFGHAEQIGTVRMLHFQHEQPTDAEMLGQQAGKSVEKGFRRALGSVHGFQKCLG